MSKAVPTGPSRGEFGSDEEFNDYQTRRELSIRLGVSPRTVDKRLRDLDRFNVIIRTCCSEMLRAREFRLIAEADGAVNIYYRHAVEDSYELFPIAFCPFCGKSVR